MTGMSRYTSEPGRWPRRRRVWGVRALIALLVSVQVSAGPAQAATLVFVNPADSARPAPRRTGACVPAEREAIAKALQLAQVRVKRVVETMRDRRAAILPQFFNYFGVESVADYDEVAKNYQSALDSMAVTNTEKLVVYCRLANEHGEPCSDGIRSARLVEPGLTPPQTEDIRGLEAVVFCGRFFLASGTREYTQWGSVFHEFTHIAFGAVDHEYGADEVADLALRSPETARINAETYRQFAERLTAGPNP